VSIATVTVRGSSRRTAWLALAGGAAGVALAILLLRGDVRPLPTWFYVAVWYATLLALAGAVTLTAPAERATTAGAATVPVFGRPAFLLSIFGWSALFWLFFEVLNFRLRDWYYVFVPVSRAERWVGILVSFATVIPAVLLMQALLSNIGIGRKQRWPPLRLTPGRLRGLQWAGGIMLVLPMLWPHWFFPLVWGFTTLLLEPIVYRRAPERSLLHDLQEGRPGRLLRLLLAGLCVGFLWEVYNIGARSKWIYTVPGFEAHKLFEMPLAGFLGFAPFAVDCFVFWQALVVAGLAVSRSPGKASSTGRRPGRLITVGFLLVGLGFAALALLGMERWTISSVSPRLEALNGAPVTRLEAAGYNVFSLARARPATVAREVGADNASAAGWIATARLAVLRGIGMENAQRLRRAGVRTVEDLAAAGSHRIIVGLRAEGVPVVPARVRVWVRAARAVAGAGGTGNGESER
jgi:hypothetical protein